ncbi:MAG: hypothetical protein QM756_15820 [Polyangiaceae bacterium]
MSGKPAELLGEHLGLFALGLRALRCGFLQLFDLDQVALGGRQGEPARQQEIASKARAHAYDFATGAEVVDVALQ